MRDIVLITNQEYNLKDVRKALGNDLDCTIFFENDRITLQYIDEKNKPLDRFIQIEKAPEIEKYYDPDELESFKKRLISPKFYLIHFKDIIPLKEFLIKIANREDVIIDNDNDLIMPAKEFLKNWDENPSWDWAEL